MIRKNEDISMYCAKLLYWQSYLLCYFVGLHRILYRVIEEVDLPDSIETVLSPLQSSKEFPFRRLYPGAGGSSGNDLTKFVKATLNCIGSSMVCICMGITFHNRGPVTANELSCSAWLRWLLDLAILGTTAFWPCLRVTENWIPISLGHLQCRTFHVM